jgi:hypothetical protein
MRSDPRAGSLGDWCGLFATHERISRGMCLHSWPAEKSSTVWSELERWDRVSVAMMIAPAVVMVRTVESDCLTFDSDHCSLLQHILTFVPLYLIGVVCVERRPPPNLSCRDLVERTSMLWAAS